MEPAWAVCTDRRPEQPCQLHCAGVWFSAAYLGQHNSSASTDFTVRLTINCDMGASVHLLRRWSNSPPLPGVAGQSDPHVLFPHSSSAPFQPRPPEQLGAPWLTPCLPEEAEVQQEMVKLMSQTGGLNTSKSLMDTTYSCCYVNWKEQPGQHQNTKHPLQSKWKGRSEAGQGCNQVDPWGHRDWVVPQTPSSWR